MRYRQDGNVEFVGRKDGQVKIRGFRIETKEVEAVIRGFEGVKDATVQAYDYESGGKYLAAFVVGDNVIDTAKLADYIKSQKPAYMVPAVIMQIEKVSLTINQKVDKKALPKPKLQQREYIAPIGKTEEDFCAIFGEILGLERVGAEDDFFELGGSSVIAMRVVIAAGKRATVSYTMMYTPVDLQRDSLMRVLCAEADGKSYIYIMTYYINFDKVQVRKYIARIISVLEEKYPSDKSVHEWREIFDGTLTHRTKSAGDSKLKEAVRSKSVTPPEICVYSDNSTAQMTFVHTGNTGSEAYYRLADRIRDKISFLVIEPFNLYHIEQATYG